MANRYSQLVALTPKGSFYSASGVVLPLRDQAYAFLFAPVTPLRSFAIFDNDNAAGTTSSNGAGNAIVSLVLAQGFHRITIIDDVDGSKFNAYITIRVSALAQVAHAEAIEQIDTSNQQIEDSLALQTATPNFIEDVFGKSLKQPNDFGSWVTDSYRRLLKWMRQAFRLFGSKLTGVRQSVAAYTSSVPLRVPRSWRPWWRLGTQLMPNGDLQSYARTTASPLTNLNARSVNYVHVAYSGGAANIFSGTITNPPNGPEVLRVRFSIGWAGGTVTVFGTDASGVTTSDTFAPLAAQPLVAAEDVDGAVSFETITSITKSSVAGVGTAAVGLRDSRFITIDEVGSYNALGIPIALTYTASPDQLAWGAAVAPQVLIPSDGPYTLYNSSLSAQLFGLEPEPGGLYAGMSTEHFMRVEADDLGIVLADLSNETFNASGFNGTTAATLTQAQVALALTTYVARDVRYGAVQAAGSISFTAPAVDLDTVTLRDGVNTALVFRFLAAAPPAVPDGIYVALSGVAATDAAALAAAINNGYNDPIFLTGEGAAGALRITAYASGVDVFLRNDFGGTQGNTTITIVGGFATTTNMTGGANATQFAGFAAAVAGTFSNAIRLQRFGTGLLGVLSSVRVHASGADASLAVMGMPRYASTLAVSAAARAVSLTTAAAPRLPAVDEVVILHAAFPDSPATVTVGFVQPTSAVALEVFFDGGWRGGDLRVDGYDLSGAVISDTFVRAGHVVVTGTGAFNFLTEVTLAASISVAPGMFFRNTTTGVGAFIRWVRNSLSLVLESAVATIVGDTWEIVQNVVIKGTVAFQSIVQTVNLGTPVGVTAGTATLSVIDGELRGYVVRVGRGLRDSGAAVGAITVSANPSVGTFAAAGAYQSEYDDAEGELLVRGSTQASGTNNGLHRMSLGIPGDTGLSITHQTASQNGRFATENPLPGTWRVYSTGNLARVVGRAGTVLTLYPPGVARLHAIGALVELATEMPHEQRGVDGPGTLTVTVDKALTPVAGTADSLTLEGSAIPDGWLISGSTAPYAVLDTPGFLVPSRMLSVADGANWTLQQALREQDVKTYRGFLLRVSFWLQMHVTGGGTVQINFVFDGVSYVGTPVPGSAASNPQAITESMLASVGGSGALDPQLVQAQYEVPAGAEECIIQLQWPLSVAADLVSVEKCTVVAVPSTGLFLGSGTVPLSAHEQKFGEVLYSWSPEVLNTSERRGLGVGENLSVVQPVGQANTIDRVVNAHGVWDRYDVSEYSGLPAVNLVGAYTDIDWLSGTLSNMVLDIGTPARASVVRPIEVSLLQETLAFTPATSQAPLAETSAHEGTLLGPKGTAALTQALTVQTLTDSGANFPLAIIGTTIEVRDAIHAVNNGFYVITARPTINSISWTNALGSEATEEPSFLGTYRVRVLFPEESFVEEQLLEDDVPVAATPSIVGGVLPWRFQTGSVLDIASASSGDPAAQQIFNAAATYVLTYRRLTRATTATLDLGAAFEDYRWLVDPAVYRRRNPASSTFARSQSLTFAADFTAPLDVPSNEDEATTVLVRDNGLVRTELPVSVWRYVDQSTISIDGGEFDAASIFSLSYQALEPNYPAPANIVVERRSSAVSLADVLLQPWVVTQVDDLVETVRYHQLRVTIDGIVDVRDVEVAGLGLRGLHLYGAAPFAPGIL